MKVLVVDDDATLRLTVKLALEERGYEVDEAEDGMVAVAKVESCPDYDCVLLDVNMPNMSGLEALQRIREINSQIFCLILTAYSDVKDAVTAIKHGAYDYVEKPVDGEQIVALLDLATQANALVEKIALSAPSFAEGRNIIGDSNKIRRVFDIIYRLSKVDTPVLIRGESGTGKELVARALHYNSHRKKGPFVGINCAAIPDNLIESEFFGYERGAFTGADRKKVGKFQYALGGTLFLDEIGDISASMQVKLLRVLQEKVFSPIGGNKDVAADVRVVAATNAPLEDMIDKGGFRSDLFYRLNVMPIILPPLRERVEDIESLVEFMINKFNEEHSRNIAGISKAGLACLQKYNWPGNIRELENVIEHAFIMETGDWLEIGSLPDVVRCEFPAGALELSDEQVGHVDSAIVAPWEGQPDGEDSLNYPELKAQFEKEFIIKALKTFNGRVNKTAAHTKMTKVTLLRKLEKYGINPREYYPT